MVRNFMEPSHLRSLTSLKDIGGDLTPLIKKKLIYNMLLEVCVKVEQVKIHNHKKGFIYFITKQINREDFISLFGNSNRSNVDATV